MKSYLFSIRFAWYCVSGARVVHVLRALFCEAPRMSLTNALLTQVQIKKNPEAAPACVPMAGAVLLCSKGSDGSRRKSGACFAFKCLRYLGGSARFRGSL